MKLRYFATILAALVSVASCADGNAGDTSFSTERETTPTSTTDAPSAAAEPMPVASATEFFDRLDAIAVTLGLDVGQPVSDWRRDGITTEQLTDICTNAFTGVPPSVDELTAQREFAVTIAACPEVTVEYFLRVHPAESSSANTDYSVFAELVSDMIVAATAKPPSTTDDAVDSDERPLTFVPIEIAADPDFVSGQFPEPPQPDGSVIAKVGQVGGSIAVSLSPFDPGANTNCLAVSIMPLGAYTRLDALSGAPCVGVDLDDDHPALDFYRIEVDGEMFECDGVRTVVLDIGTDTLAMAPEDAAALLDSSIPASSTDDLDVGVQLTTGLLEAPGPGSTAGTNYFVPLTAEFPGRIAPDQLAELGTGC